MAGRPTREQMGRTGARGDGDLISNVRHQNASGRRGAGSQVAKRHDVEASAEPGACGCRGEGARRQPRGLLGAGDMAWQQGSASKPRAGGAGGDRKCGSASLSFDFL